MSKPKIQIYDDLEAMSRAAALHFAALATQSSSGGRRFSCALSGGSTPRRMFELLANPDYQIPWEQVDLFQVDERAVLPDDAESNYRMIRERLLSKVPASEVNFHRMQAERPDRDAAAQNYADELGCHVQSRLGDFPRLDLIFLGMGPDGHTASLFPSSAALAERKLWVCSNFSPRLGKYRMTMTFPVLNAAAEIIFLESGEDKAETLHRVLEGPPGVFPAQEVRPVNGRLIWFVDKAAARLLTAAGICA